MNRYEIIKNPDTKPCFAPVLPKVKKPKAKRTPVLDRQALISNALTSAEGRQSLAQAMAAPLHRRLDYASVARRAFNVTPLPEGALPVYSSMGTTEFQGLTGIHNG
jgi:hypothetical protein